MLALGVQIGEHAGVIVDEARILFRASLQCLLRGFVVDGPITFDHVQSLRVRSAELVDHGVRARLDSNGIDHQRIALVMADGISKPGRRQLRGMSLVQAHVADFMIEDIQDGDAVRPLEHLHAEIIKDERHPAGPALIDRIRSRAGVQLFFGVRLHDIRRPGLQDRIGVIANPAAAHAHNGSVRGAEGLAKDIDRAAQGLRVRRQRKNQKHRR